MPSSAFFKDGNAGQGESKDTPRGSPPPYRTGLVTGRRLALGLLLAALPLHAATFTSTFSLSQTGSDIGLLSPYRHGLINELQINPDTRTRILTPNLSFNKDWGNVFGWQFISNHEINTPLLFLNSSGCESGCGQDLSLAAPQTLNLYNQLQLRRQFSRGLTVTPSIGLELNSGGFSSTELDLLGVSYNPYPSGYSINTGIDISGNFAHNWGYAADLEYFSITGQNSTPVLGHKAMLFYSWNRHRRLSLGYKYTNGLGNVQYDTPVYPTLDFLWSWE